MGNVERCDKTLPLNEMIFYVRKDARLRERWTSDLEGLAREFGLSRAEYEAVRDKDVRRLNEMGVHQYYIPQILRLFYGASANANSHPALEAYKRAYPQEAAQWTSKPRPSRLWGRCASGWPRRVPTRWWCSAMITCSTGP